MLLCFNSTITQAASYTLYYDGQQHEYTGSSYKLIIDDEYIETSVEPLIFNDYTLVPVRDVFETIGASVNYISLKQEIYVNYNNTHIKLAIGDNTAYINSKSLLIPGGITPMLISVDGGDAKTMVPLRFISENLGFTVDFDGDKGLIGISTKTAVVNTNIIDFQFREYDELTTKIEVYSDKPITSMTSPKQTDSNVLYFDIDNCSYSLPNSNLIDTIPIKQLRFGSSDNKTRIAIDTNNMKSYKVNLSKDKMAILISVTASSPETDENGKEDYIKGENNIKDDEEQNTSVNTDEKIVIIDAGHGGSDPGASGSVDGKVYYEKEINLSIAKKVRDILLENGVNVIMTRDDDTYPSLTDRSDLANMYNAAIFASIHSNSATTDTVSGFEVYYSTMNNSSATGLSSSQLASSVSKAIDKEISIRNRGVKTADHVVTRSCTMPAILIETGFMSTPNELALMITEDFQNNFAIGVANGILSVIDKANPPQE